MTTSALMTFLVLVITVLLLFGLYGHLLPSVAMPTQDKVHTGFSGGTGLSFLTLVFSQRPKVFSAMEEGQHVWTRLWQTCSHALYTKIHDLIHNIWQCDVSVLETYMPAQPDVFSLCMKSHSLCSPPVCPLTPCSIISNKTECWPCCDSQGFQRAEEACYTHSNGKEDPFKTPSQNMVGMSQARCTTLPHDLARCIQEVYTGAVALLSDQLVDGAKELKDLYLYFVSSCKHYLFNWMPSQTTPPAKR